MIKLRQNKNFKVYLFESGVYWVVNNKGEIVLKTNSMQEYIAFIK